MEAPGLRAQLRRHRAWLAVGMVVAAIAASSPFTTVGFVPPSIKLKPFAHATASTELAVGLESSVGSEFPDSYDTNLSPRSATLADVTASPQLLGYVARAAGIPASKIAVDAPLSTDLWRAQQWDTGEKRASQIVAEKDPYRITLDNDPNGAPAIDVTTQAPSANAAARLARGVPEGLNAYLSQIQAASRTPLSARYNVSELAPITMHPASTGQLANVAVFTFLAVFVLWCGLVLAVSSFARDLRVARPSSKVRARFDRSSGNGTGSPEPTYASTSRG